MGLSFAAPLAGRDFGYLQSSNLSILFQSTRPLRGATAHGQVCKKHIIISIHAPLAGRDRNAFSPDTAPSQFQSTRPLRGATLSAARPALAETFQSTRPLRGATKGRNKKQ